MATKRLELEKAARGQGCLGKARDEDAIFVLTRSDKIAPLTILHWAYESLQAGAPKPKIAEALRLCADMLEQQAAVGSKVPD